MAGMGRPPKDPADRARRNVDPVPRTTVPHKPARQPKLPAWPDEEGDWPERTKEWWKAWGKVPQAAAFDQGEWEYLLDTAWVHARFWRGVAGTAAELRLRMAKFGVTPEDRMRLRMTRVNPDGKPVAEPRNYPGTVPANGSAASRYAGLRVVGGTDELEPEGDEL